MYIRAKDCLKEIYLFVDLGRFAVDSKTPHTHTQGIVARRKRTVGKEGGRDTLVYTLWISMGPGLTLSGRKRVSGVQQAGMTFRSPPWRK